MEKIYKAIISNKQIYREIELSGETNRITAGNTKDCHVRFRSELFFPNSKSPLKIPGTDGRLIAAKTYTCLPTES